jgi:hypothetical protein
MNNETPQVMDHVLINDTSTRIDYIIDGDYGIFVTDGFALDHSELTLVQARSGYGSVSTWVCWTDNNGKRN